MLRITIFSLLIVKSALVTFLAVNGRFSVHGFKASVPILSGDIQVCKLLSLTEGASWLGKRCTTNSTCISSNSQCFKGKCLCSPGYYYSEEDRTCIGECPQSQLGMRMVKYRESAMGGDYMDDVHPTTPAQCVSACLNSTSCRSLTYFSFQYPGAYHIQGHCLRFNLTARGAGVPWYQNAGPEYDHYQRTCA